ncbi:MAG: hypothetical protein KGM42_06465 [Hyphomicrobiales bacterium]|nr:hypothetical protein [Hyphomicrobiales bacterium]
MWIDGDFKMYTPGTYKIAVCHGGSTDISHTLEFQKDGNLVLYMIGNPNKALWSSQTAGKSATGLIFQPDGNFVIYANKKALWQTGTANHPQARGFLKADEANVVIYDCPSDFSCPVLWRALN